MLGHALLPMQLLTGEGIYNDDDATRPKQNTQTRKHMADEINGMMMVYTYICMYVYIYKYTNTNKMKIQERRTSFQNKAGSRISKQPLFRIFLLKIPTVDDLTRTRAKVPFNNVVANSSGSRKRITKQ